MHRFVASVYVSFIDRFLHFLNSTEKRHGNKRATNIHIVWTWNFLLHIFIVRGTANICGISYCVHNNCTVEAYIETHFFANILVVAAHYTMVLLLLLQTTNCNEHIAKCHRNKKKFANLIINWNKLSRKPKQTDIITLCTTDTTVAYPKTMWSIRLRILTAGKFRNP